MKTPYTANQHGANRLQTSAHDAPHLARLLLKKGTVNFQENSRQRLKRLVRRMASIEVSMPAKAAIYRYEISPRYRRIE